MLIMVLINEILCYFENRYDALKFFEVSENCVLAHFVP